MATLLNVAGLSVAFAAFILLLMQVSFDWGFDRFHKNADKIYRLGIVSPDWGTQIVQPRPFIDEFIASSPHIKEGAGLIRLTLP